TLVFVDYRQAGRPRQLACKRPHFLRLRADRSIHILWQPHHDLHSTMAFCNLLHRTYVGLHILAFYAFQSGSRDSQWIRDSNSDTAVTNVKSNYSRFLAHSLNLTSAAAA